MHRLGLIALSALACSALPTPARAHVCMLQPLARAGADCSSGSPQKVGPCGVNQRGSNVTVFRPGETITVKLNETINHPSHYRISFNPDGDAFEDPTSKDDNTGAHPFVLKDNITDEPVDDQTPDDPSMTQSVQITLPNVHCETCTLQLIQVMYDKGGNGFGGNDGPGGKTDNDDIYYACADIALRGDPAAADAGPSLDAGTSDAGASDAGNGATDAGDGKDAATPAEAGASADASTPSEVANSEEDDANGCSCSVAEPALRYDQLVSAGLFALAWLTRRRRVG